MTRWIMATDHRPGHGLKERRELSGEGATITWCVVTPKR